MEKALDWCVISVASLTAVKVIVHGATQLVMRQANTVTPCG